MSASFNEITSNELQKKIDQSADSIQLVDVREYPEYASGHIPAAKWIPLGKLQKQIDELDRSKETILMCLSGKRSAQAQHVLRSHNFAKVSHLNNGLQSWKQSGGALHKEAKAPWSLERQVRVAAGSLIVASVLLATFIHYGFIGIAGVVGAGLIFAGITDWCGMGLLLAKMPWNQHKDPS
jgi:rhodanese-related sulfurtransferase